MKADRRRHPHDGKRRTTLTLPAESLAHASRIARSRNVTLSTVVAEALSEGLRMQAAADKSEQVLANYRAAFAGFSEEETMLLDGVSLEPARKARRRSKQ